MSWKTLPGLSCHTTETLNLLGVRTSWALSLMNVQQAASDAALRFSFYEIALIDTKLLAICILMHFSTALIDGQNKIIDVILILKF